MSQVSITNKMSM